MSGCTWAGCTRPATSTVDDWELCPVHAAEHHALAGKTVQDATVDAVIREAHARGLTDAQIAAELLVEHRGLARRRRRLGLVANRGPYGLTEPQHGTPSGARQHYRRGEKPCRPCLEAAASATRKQGYPDSRFSRRSA